MLVRNGIFLFDKLKEIYFETEDVRQTLSYIL